MKADYILEKSSGRRRTPRLRLLLSGLLMASSVALALSLEGNAAHQPTHGNSNVMVLSQPLPVTSDTAEPEVAAAQPQSKHAAAGTPLPPLATPTALGGPLAAGPPVQTLVEVPGDEDLVANLYAPESDADFDGIPPLDSGVDITPPATVESAPDWIEVTVARGDTLSGIFSRNELPAADWMRLLKLEDAAKALNGLRPGDEMQIRRTADGHLAELVYPIDAGRTLHIARDKGEYRAKIEQKAFEHRRAFAQGEIESSLYLAGAAAGLSDRLIMELTHIFAWKIDFAREIRKGDRFTIIYDQIFSGGEKIRNGEILAARFVNRGEVYQAFRYTDEQDRSSYYTADGESLRKALLRAPLDYAYVSSPFDRHRMHPILNIVRPHLGTDYAAHAGTPVKAAGDGRVAFAGYKGGYGNVVVIRHNARYETVYGHLKEFADGLGAGDAVSQGELIGFVGSTGLSTGPHLHFGLRVDGRFEDARTWDMPNATPVPEDAMAEFQAATQPLLARLQELGDTEPTRVARTQEITQ